MYVKHIVTKLENEIDIIKEDIYEEEEIIEHMKPSLLSKVAANDQALAEPISNAINDYKNLFLPIKNSNRISQ